MLLLCISITSATGLSRSTDNGAETCISYVQKGSVLLVVNFEKKFGFALDYSFNATNESDGYPIFGSRAGLHLVENISCRSSRRNSTDLRNKTEE